MAAKKFYAVRKGRQTGIFSTWPVCQQQIQGFSGAEYKSFPTLAEAEAYLAGGQAAAAQEKEQVVAGPDIIEAYVDGSYHAASGAYSAGVVLLWDGRKETLQEKREACDLAGMRNVAGEILGAMLAMQYAAAQGVRDLVIYHDYEGIAKWCTGAWEARLPGTQQYRAYYRQMTQKLNIRFVKVRAHTGDTYNEEADRLAKAALGIA